MSNLDEKTTGLDAQATPQQAVNPAYEQWAERKIKAALADDIANPDKRLSQDKVWDRFGLAP